MPSPTASTAAASSPVRAGRQRARRAPADLLLRPGSAYAAVCSCRAAPATAARCAATATRSSAARSTATTVPDRLDHRRVVEGRRLELLRRRRPLLHGLPRPAAGAAAAGAASAAARATARPAAALTAAATTARRVARVPLRQVQQPPRCIGPILCRVVTCTPPWPIEPSCSAAAVRTDNNTRFHDAACPHPPPPPIYPVTGDWDGTGRSGIGFYDNRDGAWTLRRPPGRRTEPVHVRP